MNRELEIKLARIRNMMAQKDLDAVYLKGQDNFAWLTCGGRNYVGMGAVGNCGLLVTKDKMYAVTNNIEAPRMIDEEHLESLGFEMVYGVWHDTSFEKNALASLVPSGKIGYDTSSSAKDVQLLRFDLVEEEIERYKKIGEDASIAMEEAASERKVGMSEYEVSASIMAKR